MKWYIIHKKNSQVLSQDLLFPPFLDKIVMNGLKYKKEVWGEALG
jgi:hypothetical protein